MPTKQECEQIQSDFETLKSLRDEFHRELDEAVKSGEVEKAKKLKQEIEIKLASLKERVNPLERLLHVKEQYERQRNILEHTGIIETLSSGEMGVRGIDGREYPMPTLEMVRARLKEKRELLKTKAEQGFTKILIVPQGMSLDDLVKKYGELIIKHFKEGKLLDSQNNSITNLRRQGEVSDGPQNDATGDQEYYPVWKWETYTNADISGELVYYPQEFSKELNQKGEPKHQGKSKNQLLEEQGAWNIIVIENNSIIPGEDEPDEIKGGRKRIKAGKSPTAYLADLQSAPEYRGESGLTPEEWLIQAMTHLEETNQVLDDWQGKGKISYNLGAYFKSSDNVPFADWYRDYRRADLGGYDSSFQDPYGGARSAVRVEILKT